MANKLPWFTHDHDAHDDQFISDSMERFGHFGYAAYFIILELLHKDGTGDILSISASRLCQKLRSRRAQVRLYLDFSQTSGKIKFTWKSDEVELQINKFRERQSNLKTKIISKPFQPRVKTTQEGEGEGEGERENRLVPAAPEAKPKAVKTEPPKPKKLTPQQVVVRYFKEAKGVHADDKDWDRKHWNGRLGKEASALLKAFDGDPVKAGRYLLIKGEEWAHLPDWGINGVIAAAARDPRVNEQTGDQEHERTNGALDAAGPPGPRRLGGFTRAGEIAGDALAAIGQQATLHRGGQGQLAGPPDDRFDDDPFEA